MPHHILAGQAAEGNVFNLPQDIHRHLKTASGFERKILLRQVAGDDDLGSEANPCEEHLHLCRRRILCLVQDDKRIVQRPSPHIRKGCHFDQPLLQVLLAALRPHDLVQGVIQRPQIRIYLTLKITR